ncbi:hypothetical protein BAY59_00420 [Prauserella coralliicola]|nr:hypothetical protein BAY59_00420 [Prauserella coralliicola]
MSYDIGEKVGIENTRFWVPLSLTAEQKRGISGAVDTERVANELPMMQIASSWVVSADPDEVVARTRSYVEAASRISCCTHPAVTRRGCSMGRE